MRVHRSVSARTGWENFLICVVDGDKFELVSHCIQLALHE